MHHMDDTAFVKSFQRDETVFISVREPAFFALLAIDPVH